MSDLSYAPISSVPVSDTFFDTLHADYQGFEEWLKRKGAESAYLACRADGGLDGFLYLKLEDGAVTDVQPPLKPAKRLQLGTLKVNPHGTRLGERLMKKIFDHATEQNVDEIHVAVFPNHAKLVELSARYGSTKVGTKTGPGFVEDVMLRSLRVLSGDVVRDYPLINATGRKFLLGLYPKFHTQLLPDSKLLTELPDIVKDVSHTNSIHKIYLTKMQGAEQLRRSDLLVTHRTSDDKGPRALLLRGDLLEYCAPYSVFTDQERCGFWTKRQYSTLIKFTFNAALKTRLTRQFTFAAPEEGM